MRDYLNLRKFKIKLLIKHNKVYLVQPYLLGKRSSEGPMFDVRATTNYAYLIARWTSITGDLGPRPSPCRIHCCLIVFMALLRSCFIFTCSYTKENYSTSNITLAKYLS